MGTGGELVWMLGGGIFVLVLIGAAFLAVVLIRWRSIPPGNDPRPNAPPPEFPQGEPPPPPAS